MGTTLTPSDSETWYSRTATLLGTQACDSLSDAKVCVAGVGGVGGYAAEMLARAGVGHLTLIDADDVALTNINRQLIATHDTVGQPKVELFAERFRKINPSIRVDARKEFLTPAGVETLLAEKYDFVIDAIDSVAPKVALIIGCLRTSTPVISSMGAGGRLNPGKVGIMKLSETRDDGLARAVRQRLKKAGVKRDLKVVASTEVPRRHALIPLEERNKRSSFGTLATIPAIFGIYLASAAIDAILSRRSATQWLSV